MADLQRRYRDRISGFEGTAVARTEYIGGRITICLERGDATKKPESVWIDQARLDEIEIAGSPVGFVT